MARIIKGRQMAARYWKGREVLKEYKQGRLVYEKSSSIPDYLCFTALEAGQFTLTIPAAVTATYLSYIEWSKDGRTWNHTDNTSEAVTIPVSVASGEKVYWRGSGNCMTALNAGESNSSKFSSTCRFDASGNITSLLLGVNYVTALVNYSTSGVRNVTFANLFRGCTTIVNAKDLILPTFTSYYTYIFYYMFYRCTSLVSSPALVSSELSTACYSGLYRECSNLAQSQVLLAPNLVGFCYRNMFQATKVNNVKCLATDISANECVTNWLLNVSSTGTFIQASGVTWPRGASGIPSGWIINPDYLCFTALDDNTQFTFTKHINLPNANLPSISYSLDGGDTWTEVEMKPVGNEDIVTTPVVNAGGKVLWKAEAGRFALAPDKYSTFTANGRFNVSGNIMSLLYGDNHYDKTDTRAYTYSFGPLFRDSTNLIDASQLKLPTGHLNAADLLGLFLGCTNLVHGAPLYAPNIPDSCCYNMYRDCTSMTEMPTIAATSMLKDDGTTPSNYGLYYTFYHCSNMEGEVKLNIVGDVGQQVLDACFTNCSKITSADLAFNGALGKMALRGAFVGCTLLSHVKCLATSFYDDGTAANGSLYNWMNNVSRTGTFIQASGVTWPRGKSGIPDNWTIETQTP